VIKRDLVLGPLLVTLSESGRQRHSGPQVGGRSRARPGDTFYSPQKEEEQEAVLVAAAAAAAEGLFRANTVNEDAEEGENVQRSERSE